jgi:hypothetical protein
MNGKVMDPVTFCHKLAKEAQLNNVSKSDRETLHFGVVNLIGLIYSCPLFETLKPRQVRRYQRLFAQRTIEYVNHHGVVDAIKSLKTIASDFSRLFKWGSNKVITYDDLSVVSESPIYLAISALIKLDLTSSLATRVVKWVYNWHIFLAKVPINRSELEAQTEEEWVQTQLGIADKSFYRQDDLIALRAILKRLYHVDLIEGHLGKHGPGSTASGAKSIKDKELGFFPTLQSEQIVDRQPAWVPYIRRMRMSSAVLKAVAKDIGALRTITMEEAVMQYAQQCIKLQMYRNIENDVVWASQFIKFSSQESSRRLALRGSRYSRSSLKPCTYDLSKASDTVSVDLVINTFPSSLLHELMCSRTWDVQTSSHGVVEIDMFAGMGSAVTFPVQSLLFIAISILGVFRALEKQRTSDEISSVDCIEEYLNAIDEPHISKYLKIVRVYGDDIIVPELAAQEVGELLTRLGLTVNKDKSFTNDYAFREACGIFAYAGVDITPARYRVDLSTRLLDYAQLESLRMLTNLAFINDYKVVYRICMKRLREAKPFMGTYKKKKRSLVTYNDFILYEPLQEAKEAVYLGVLTSRTPTTGQPTLLKTGETLDTVTALIGKQKTEKSWFNDDYHLDVSLRAMSYDDVFTPDHGRIQQGIRVVPRKVHRKNIGEGWAWIPSGPYIQV